MKEEALKKILTDIRHTFDQMSENYRLRAENQNLSKNYTQKIKDLHLRLDKLLKKYRKMKDNGETEHGDNSEHDPSSDFVENRRDH